MRASLFGRIAILGTGLIGGSLAAALSKHQIALHIAAYDPVAENTAFLHSSGFAHSVHDNAAEAVKNADLVILGVPPEALSNVVASIAEHLKKGCIVTDVTSIKRRAVEAITSSMPAHAFFVPAHPIAGSEKTGAAAADAELFSGKRIIMTPTEEQVLSEPVAQVRGLWEALGGKVEYMPADLHDRIYAYVSHLPQIAAYAAAPSVGAANSEPACAGVVRLAKSDKPLWADICIANADFIHEALEDFSTFLMQMQSELEENSQAGTIDNNAETVAPPLLCAVLSLCLVATSLVLEQRTGANVGSYGGTGFRDMTAAAGRQSDSVLEAISAHPEAVATLLKLTVDRLNAIGAALSLGDKTSLQKAFGA